MRNVMGVMSAWMFGWTALGLAVLALAAAGGVYLVRALAGHGAVRDPVAVMPAQGLAEAMAELRRRYAAGQITREEYLQGKVDLE